MAVERLLLETADLLLLETGDDLLLESSTPVTGSVPLGVFDPTAVVVGWFAPTLQAIGWYDEDLIDAVSTPGAYTLTADSGAFVLSGQDVVINIGRTLAADAGAYVIAGQDAALNIGRTLTAEAGAYVLAGQDAALTVVPAGGTAYTLTADAGEFVISGKDAAFVLGTSATDTHDGYWSKQWAKLKKRKEEPTIAEVVELVKESPQVLEVVRAEVVRKYPQVDYAAVRENVQLQRFIARQLIEAAQEEDDIETLLLMA